MRRTNWLNETNEAKRTYILVQDAIHLELELISQVT